MRLTTKILASVIALLTVAFCVMGLFACGEKECDHTFGEWVTMDATCTDAGKRTRTCTVCAHQETEAIAALGHSWSDASCDAGKVCANCGATDGDASGHRFTQETVKDAALKSAATCKSAAVYYKSCSCGTVSTNEEDIFESGSPIAHKDDNLDHICDYECGKTDVGNHSDSATDDDHVCDYGCKAVLEVCLDAEGDGDHKCDICAKAGASSHSWGKAACSAATNCTECGAEPTGNVKPHIYDQNTVKPEAVKSEADCEHAAVYYKSCSCGKVGSDATFEFGTELGHSFTVDTVSESALLSAASCKKAATYYKSCSCGEISTSNADTFTVGKALDHVYDQSVVSEDALLSEADCENAAVYHKSCICGDICKNNTDVFESGSSVGHSYVETDRTAATCETAETVTYTCHCSDSYEETIGTAKGHDISGQTPEERHVEKHEYVEIYVCQRQDCGKEVEGKTVYKHEFVATVNEGEEATCEKDGIKTFNCSCGHSETEKIPASALYHNWVKGDVDSNGVRTDTCSHCKETKSVTVYEGTQTGATNADNLADSEIALKDANITLGQGVVDTIKESIEGENKDVSVSATTITGTDRDQYISNEEQREQIGESPIYDFTITDGKGNYISKFGEGNYATVTVPYTLKDGEDIDAIAVWYISDDGTLKSIKATYSNGYVTFVTDHFSLYTVTLLTPEERCLLHGHNWATYVEKGSCTKDAYTLTVCARCHVSEKKIDKVATGHKYLTETKEATCDQNGYVEYTCEFCEHTYKTRIPATGHLWSVADSKPASCEEAGYTEYVCDNCESSYIENHAKLPHAYTETTVRPTCDEIGYTVYECGNCEEIYVDDYVPATGHDYAIGGWEWASDFKTATLTILCANNEEHNITLDAAIGTTVFNGTCSSFLRTTYTAAVSFGGEVYTDVKIVEIGTPNHTYSSDWKHDETGHWHECLCGEKSDFTEHTFGEATETKAPSCGEAGEKTAYCSCGEAKVTAVRPTGNHDYKDGFCTGCGKEFVDTYYLNLINSYKSIDGFSVTIRDLSFEMNLLDDSVLGAFKVLGKVKQLDVTEINLYVENGALYGAATGDIVIYNGPFPNENARIAFRAVIVEDEIYLVAEYGKPGCEEKIRFQANAKEFIESAFISSGSETTDIVFEFLFDTVVPAIDTVLTLHSSEVDAILEDIFNMVFTFEEDAQGNTVATLDYDKIRELNENLATKTIAEVVDIYFGEGSFDSLIDLVMEILDLEISEIPDYLDEMGFDTDDLFAKLDELNKDLGNADFNTESIFTSEEVKGVKLGDYVGEDYEKLIDELADTLREKSLYAILFPGCVKVMKNEIDGVIDTIADSVSISFVTDKDGVVKSISLDVDQFKYEEDDTELTLDVSVGILFNEKVTVDYAELKAEIESLIVTPDAEDAEPNYSLPSFEEGYFSFTYQGETYASNSFRHVIACVPDYSKVNGIIIMDDCGDWLRYSLGCGGTEFEYVIAYVNIEDEQVLFVVDTLNDTAAALYETETGYTVVFEDGTTKDIEYDHSTNLNDWLNGSNGVIVGTAPTGNGVSAGVGGIVTAAPAGNGENVSSGVIVGGNVTLIPLLRYDAGLYFLIFENPQGVEVGGYAAGENFWYNTKTGEFAYESQHVITSTSKHEDDCCENGSIVESTCENCDYYYSYKHYAGANGYTVDLKEYGYCGGGIFVEECGDCGKIIYCNDDILRYCNISSEFYGAIMDDQGKVIGGATMSVCGDCGLTFVISEWSKKGSGCNTTYYAKYEIYLDDELTLLDPELIFEYEDSCEKESHNYVISYECDNDNCEEYYKVIHTCTECSDSYSYYQHGEHLNETFSIDLSEHGCGGTLSGVRCMICKKITFPGTVDIECDMPDAVDTEEVIDGITYTVSTYVCPDCGMKVVIKTWDVAQTNCITDSYVSYVVYNSDNECIFEYNFLNNRDVSHEYEVTYDSDHNVIHTCKKCLDEIYGDKNHYDETHGISLGGCGTKIYGEYCSICDSYTIFYHGDNCCHWSDEAVTLITDDNGNVIGSESVYTCIYCGLVRTERSWIVDEKDCIRFIHVQTVFSRDGEELFKCDDMYGHDAHDYHTEIKLESGSCEDGYEAVVTCSKCDYYDSFSGNSHDLLTMFYADATVPCSHAHTLVHFGCACGLKNELVYNNFECVEDGVYFCGECKLKLEFNSDTFVDGCVNIEETTCVITQNGKQIYTYTSEKRIPNHCFIEAGASASGDQIVTNFECVNCDKTISVNYGKATMNVNADKGDYYFSYSFTPEKSGWYAFRFRINNFLVLLYNNYELYRADTGEAVEHEYRLGQVGVAYLEEDVTYVCRLVSYFYGEMTPDAVFVFYNLENKEWLDECCHSSTYFDVLPDGFDSCEDGIATGYFCTWCGRIEDAYISTSHETQSHDYYLEGYGTCSYAYFEYKNCACGSSGSAWLNAYGCNIVTTSNSYTDSEGRVIYEVVEACHECGLRYSKTCYEVIDEKNCKKTTYYTVTVAVGANHVVEEEYSITEDWHDYKKSFDVHGDSCCDGVTYTISCSNCDYKGGYDFYSHETFEKEIIYISEYGSVCGGYVSLYSCPCGEINSVSLDNVKCDHSQTFLVDSWIDNSINGIYTDFDNNNYYLYDRFVMYTCAVTDPTPCAFKIREATYWLKDNDSCRAYKYVNVQIGYDEKTGTCLKEMTFKTGEWIEHHDLSELSGEGFKKQECKVCQSYHYEGWEYDENGNIVKQHSIINNTLNNGRDKYREFIYEIVIIDPNSGDWYYSREFMKTIDCNGCEFYSEIRRTVSYLEDLPENMDRAGRVVTMVETDSDGNNRTTEEAYAYHNGWEYIIYSYVTMKNGDSVMYDYTYEFSVSDGCIRTTTFTKNGLFVDEYTDNICVEYMVTDSIPTCTQDGITHSKCQVCEREWNFDYVIGPHDHSWVNTTAGTYYCSECGLENENGASGEIIMDDISELYGGDEYYVVGYYMRTEVLFTKYVSLVFADGSQYDLENVTFIDNFKGLRAVAFSKAEIAQLAAEAGYSDSSAYHVKFTFVPYGGDSNLEYGITFTSRAYFSNIIGETSFVDYIPAGETVSYVINPTESGRWVFTSYSWGDTYAVLYDENGYEIASSDDFTDYNFRIEYDLEEGKTYTLVVRWCSSEAGGYVPIHIYPDAAEPEI